MKPTRSAAILLAFVLAVAPRAARAQSTVTSADIQRLQDVIYDASRDVAQMRAQDPAVAADLQRELDDARDEATYFKVKLRKNERIATGDYAELRDRVEEIRARARGAEMPRRRPVPTTGRRANPDEIPIGTEFDVRLERPLSSRTARVEDRFEATTMV